MMLENYVEVTDVSKRFSKNGAAGMRYAFADIWRDFLGIPSDRTVLRQHEFWSLNKVSFTVKPGECLALLGPNGAGKSTMLKLLSGIYLPDTGSIRMHGRLGALIELGAGFHPMLTGRENIYINGSILGLSRDEIDEKFDDIVAFSGIGSFINTAVRFYSSGMYVRLGFAIATQLRPDVMLIDEILAVGDAGFRLKCFKHLMEMSERGTAMIIVSHSPAALARICNRSLVFSNGELCFDGSLHEGMGLYHNLLNVSNSEMRNEKKEKGKGKTGEATHPEITALEAVRVVDVDGNPQEAFHTGDDICFEIHISASQQIKRARLIVAVVSPVHGNIASISSPYEDFWFDIEAPATVIRLRLRKVPLLIGGYKLNVSLCGPEVDEFFDRHQNTGAFRIVGPAINTNGYGICEAIKLAHEWERMT